MTVQSMIWLMMSSGEFGVLICGYVDKAIGKGLLLGGFNAHYFCRFCQ